MSDFRARAKISDSSLTQPFVDEVQRVLLSGLGPWRIVVSGPDGEEAVYTARSTGTVFKVMREYLGLNIAFSIQVIPHRLWARHEIPESAPAELEGEVIDAEEVSVEVVEEGPTLT